MNYQTPGVYVEEVESSSRPLEGVGTAIAAFVGLAEYGPINIPRAAAAVSLVVLVVMVVRRRLAS